MEVIYLLIPLSLVFMAVAIYVFFWAIKAEQFDDLEGPAHRVVMDDQHQRRQASRERTLAPTETATDPQDRAQKDSHHD